ncbi:MAG: hypothetical protein U9Q20_01340 [Campylobacterota bacterium]|nr:hypothetical protein [Campylobacterota bacterium]
MKQNKTKNSKITIKADKKTKSLPKPLEEIEKNKTINRFEGYYKTKKRFIN